MNRLLVFLVFILLTGCSVINTRDEKNQSSVNNQSRQLTLVKYSKNDGYTDELINFVEQVVEKNPQMGEDGKVSMNYAGATYTIEGKEYAVFLFSNRSRQTIKNNISFDLNWAYDGQYIFEKQKILYNHDDRGDLQTDKVAIIMLEITEEQKRIIDKMNDPKKMKLEIINLSVE